ncbi:hypothetical protein BH09BAC6_BH09BAC6_13620 [soil metagenome]|jgi:DNA-binding FadR family transcriptional regulator
MNKNLVPRTTLAEVVAAKIQQAILKGDYKTNQKLPVESMLMKGFGVGRSSIREAVKILVNSGFLSVRQGVGTFVEDNTGINEPLFQKLKRADVKSIDEVRKLLEMKIAESAAMNRTGNDISKLEHFLRKKTKAAEDNLLEECIDAHIDFHIVMANASRNMVLADLYKPFAVQLKAELEGAHTGTEFFKDIHGDYNKLLDSILRQDPRKAWHWSAKIAGHITQ